MPKKKKNQKKITYIAFMILYVLCIFFSGYTIIFLAAVEYVYNVNYYYVYCFIYIA